MDVDRPMRKILIKNLHHDVSQDDLRKLFGVHGSLKRVFIKFDKSGRSEGTGDVVYADPLSAELAFGAYNGKMLDGQPLELALVQDQGPRGHGRGRGRGRKRNHVQTV